MNKTTDRDLLMDRYLAGAASDEDAATIAELAGSDPGFVAELYSRAELEQDLRKVLAADEKAAPRRAGTVRFLRPLALAAAALLAAAGLWWGIRNAERGTRSTEQGTGVAAVVPVAAGEGAVVAKVLDSGAADRLLAAAGSGAGSGVKVGADVRVGDRIEAGKGRGVRLGMGKNSWVRVCPNSTVSIPESTTASPSLKLESGRLLAQVASRQAGVPLIIYTPQAKLEIKGTRFSLGVESESTRLEVLEGLVGMTRLLDGKSVDVAAGQYAVAAEGVELVALPIPPDTGFKAWEQAEIYTGPLIHLYGKVLFEDEFDRGLDNWDIVLGSDDGNYEKLAGDPARYVEFKKNYPHRPTYTQKATPVETCAWIWGERGEGRLVGIRLKKPIEAERFVVILRCGLIPPSSPRHGGDGVYSQGIEIRPRDVVDLFYDRYPTGGAAIWHQALEYHAWEFISNGKTGAEQAYFCRELVNDMHSTIGIKGLRLVISSSVRPAGKRLLFSVCRWNMIVDSVVVRELLEESVASGKAQ